jgi:hypothetical protein
VKSYGDGLAINRKRLVSLDQSHGDLQFVTAEIGTLAYRFVLARDFATALDAADLAISNMPSAIWLYTNRAHALMFLGRIDEARALYLRYRREKDAHKGKSWIAIILRDFAELRNAGRSNSLMDQMEESFASTR